MLTRANTKDLKNVDDITLQHRLGLSIVIPITFSQQNKEENNESPRTELRQGERRRLRQLLLLHLAEDVLYAGLKDSQTPKATED